MKRILSLILVFLLSISMFACGDNGQSGTTNNTPTTNPGIDKAERVLEVGYSKKDITPDWPVMMDDGMSTGQEGLLWKQD